MRRHLTAKGKLTPSKVAEVIEAIRSIAVMVTPSAIAADACRDANDLPVIGTAVAGNAEAIVTGDKDLLVLNRFQDVAILSPRAFFEIHLAKRQ